MFRVCAVQTLQRCEGEAKQFYLIVYGTCFANVVNNHRTQPSQTKKRNFAVLNHLSATMS